MTSKAPRRAHEDALPSYKKPPVTEVVCGLRFEPLGQLRVPHVGLLWDKFRDDYPAVEHAVPIGTEASILVDSLTGVPLPRIWFINSQGNQLVQFQWDRYYFNWRHRDDEYPRYSNIIKGYERARAALDEFLQELGFGPLKPLEYELTYINHIPKGSGWESTDDLPNVFTDFNWEVRQKRFLPKPANLSWHTRFPLPDDKGWLTVKLNQGKRKDDEMPVLLLELAARGMGPDMRQWFDLAHEWIVRGFADLTTDKIQTTNWKRERDTTS